MRQKSIRPNFLTILLSIFTLVLVLGRPAEAGQRFHYQGLLSGIPVFDLYLTLDLPGKSDGNYRAEAEAVTIGTLAQIYPYKAQVESNGTLRGGKIVPRQFVSQAQAFDQQTRLTLNFSPDGNLIGNSKWKGKVLDPLSALLATMLGENKYCEGQLPIFDGIARYDLALAPAGENIFIQPAKIGPFTLASVQQCLATIHILEGGDPNLAKLGLLPTQFRIGRHEETQPSYLPLQNAFILGIGEIELKLIE